MPADAIDTLDKQQPWANDLSHHRSEFFAGREGTSTPAEREGRQTLGEFGDWNT